MAVAVAARLMWPAAGYIFVAHAKATHGPNGPSKRQ
jgi:hypothetical protein